MTRAAIASPSWVRRQTSWFAWARQRLDAQCQRHPRSRHSTMRKYTASVMAADRIFSQVQTLKTKSSRNDNYRACPCLLFRRCLFVFAACRPLCLLPVARLVMSQATKCHVSVCVGNTFECKGFSSPVRVVVALNRLMLQPCLCLCGCACARLPAIVYVHCSLCACVQVMALLSNRVFVISESSLFNIVTVGQVLGRARQVRNQRAPCFDPQMVPGRNSCWEVRQAEPHR